MTTTFNKFEENLTTKLGEIQTKETYSGHMETAMASAVPIWIILGISEEDYKKKYQPDPPAAEEPAEDSTKEPTQESPLDTYENDVLSD